MKKITKITTAGVYGVFTTPFAFYNEDLTQKKS